jgi:hypothetical protein
MARPTDPTFGQGFDADLFRSAITSAMEMGLPQDTTERVTFCWTPASTFSVTDPEGNPYDLSGAPENVVEKEPVQVPVSVNFTSSKPDGTSIGDFDENRTTLTILDIYYDQIRGADKVLIDDDTFTIDYVGPPTGLFEVTVYTIYLVSVDKT